MDDRKLADSILTRYERRLTAHLLPRVPRFVQSHHLTLMTLGWSPLMIAAGLLARGDRRWLWAMSVVIVLQYLTDAVDGKIGDLRGAGLVRWGYYMDHLLDYAFLSSLLIAYTILVPVEARVQMMVVFAIAGTFMASSFLVRGVTGELPISYLKLGPAEIRCVFVAINTFVAMAGTTRALAVLPCVIATSLVVLLTLVYRTQRRLWQADAACQPVPTPASPPSRDSPSAFVS